MSETTTTPKNPWLVEAYQDISPGCQIINAESRLCKIKRSTDMVWLNQVAAWPENQKTVQLAAERRIRVLRKAARK